jgi:hypothetical protein
MIGLNMVKKFEELRPRKYPDGTKIPKNLPPAYALGNSKQNCANCNAYVPGTKYCKTWDAKVKPNYWCKKWIAIQKQK